MAKTAQQSAQKFADRAASSVGTYLEGVSMSTKDQAAAAIAAAPIYAQAVQAAVSRGAFQKGLQKSGKAGWLKGVTEKGENNYGTGVTAPGSLSKYTTESSRFDSARNAASGVARGPKGSPQNLQRVSAVINALRATKIGK